jgi:cellulose synthase/poly-beta-1,6-N-acetylglucosamine synthase-like glycosyltransferase
MKDTLEKCLYSIISQNFSKNKFEIIVVDDASTDNSLSIAKKVLRKSKVKHKILRNKRNMKIPYTSNKAIEASSGRFIAYIDSDAILEKNWLKNTLSEMRNKKIGAVAGFIKTGNPEFLWSRLAGYELEWRYAQLKSKFVDHVSTTNTLYRREALESVKDNEKYFDERFHYGLDTDMSKRLKMKGWKLVQLKNTYCLHYWKNTLKGYFKQCFNTAYARMLLMQKYKKVVMDKITTLKMLIQVPLLGLLLFFLFLSLFYYNSLLSISSFLLAIFIFLYLLLVQISRAFWVLKVKKDTFLAILFPFLLQVRNLAALYAVILYIFNKFRHK